MSATPNDTTKASTKRQTRSKKPKGISTVSGDTVSSTPIPSSPVDATRNGTPNGEASESGKPERIERESLKDISKRLKRQTKKLENIKRSEDKIKDLTEEEKETTNAINPDERRNLKDKRITEAVHKELVEVHQRLSTLTETEDKILADRFDEQKHMHEAKLAEAVKEAKEEGIKQGREEMVNEGNEKVNTLLKFLRLAGYRRSVKSENVQEDEAIEQVLVLVYSGDSSAMEACIKLAEGSTDLVGDGYDVSCRSLWARDLSNYILTFAGTVSRVKELAHDLRLDEDEDVPEEPVDADNVGGIPVETSNNEIPVATEDPDTTLPPQQTSVNGESDVASLSPEISAVTEEAIDTVPVQEETNGWGDATSPEAEIPAVEEGKALAESTGNVQPTTEPEKPDETAEGGFHDVRKRGGRGGGRGAFRSRGDFRGRGRGGYRGDRGGGEHRGDRGEPRGDRGEYRGDRGEPRGERGEYRGGRGRGGYRRGGSDGFRGKSGNQQPPQPAASS
ncbi:hypothetical protein K440DRAFT_644543 [Wilcoxina mikolae CBS 423.85]|nr:hypothetical protein K440DRAFT_644543 [Wilcoxina mikolae CBS 423.85]